MEKQKLLSEISVQCSAVQIGIAKYYDKADGKELPAILSTLRELLDSFINGRSKI